MNREEFEIMIDKIIEEYEKKCKHKVHSDSFRAGWGEAMRYSNSQFPKWIQWLAKRRIRRKHTHNNN